MARDKSMSIISPRSFTAECYAWLTGGCVIEESQGLALANGFALTNGMGCPSRAPENEPRRIVDVAFPSDYLACRSNPSSSVSIWVLFAHRILSSQPAELVRQRELPRKSTRNTGQSRSAYRCSWADRVIASDVAYTAHGSSHGRTSRSLSLDRDNHTRRGRSNHKILEGERHD